MIHFFKEVRVLREEGKIHSKLISRVRIMGGISVILLGITIYNLSKNISLAPISIVLALVGLLLGFYIFSRISAVNWDEKTEMVSASKMDMVGYVSIGLYIAFEIGLRTFLGDYFPASSESLLFAGIFGVIFGRVAGMVFEIHRVYRASH